MYRMVHCNDQRLVLRRLANLFCEPRQLRFSNIATRGNVCVETNDRAYGGIEGPVTVRLRHCVPAIVAACSLDRGGHRGLWAAEVRRESLERIRTSGKARAIMIAGDSHNRVI